MSFDRLGELQAKKAKLEELRKQREKKREATPSAADRYASVNSLVDSLLPPETPKTETVSSPEKTVPDKTHPIKHARVSIAVQTTPAADKPSAITYNKSTQTTDNDVLAEQRAAKQLKEIQSQVEAQVRKDMAQLTEEETASEPEPQTTEVDEDQLVAFMQRSMKIVNRALDEDFDLLTDYAKSVPVEVAVQDELQQLHTLTLPALEHRAVTGLDWSPHHPELVAVAYSKQSERSSDVSSSILHSPGLIRVWNLNSSSWPEYIFDAQTEILSVTFSHNSSYLLFGTGYNGRIMSWDLRSKRSSPTLQSPIGGATGAHCHPVFALTQLSETEADSKASGTLITASTDGTVCSWSQHILARPMSAPFSAKSPQGSLARYDELAVTQLAVLAADPGGLLAGCEDGKIYRVARFESTDVKPGQIDTSIYEGHGDGSVSALVAHHNIAVFGDVFLSCGFDWSIKLWRLDSQTQRPRKQSVGAFDPDSTLGLSSHIETVAPVWAASRNNVVLDVAWRPGHDSQFVAVGLEGVLEVWDLARDSINPVVRIETGKGVNKVVFDPSGGRVVCGGVDSVVQVWKFAADETSEDRAMGSLKMKQLRESDIRS